MRFTAILMLIISTSNVGFAAEWQEVKNDTGIKVSLADYEGANGKAFKSEIILDFPFTKVLDLFSKADKYQSWFHLCDSAKLITQSETGSTIYLTIDMPWPVTDRDVVYNLEKKQISGTEVRYEVGQKNDLTPAAETHIRMPKIGGAWDFVDLGNGKTRVTWEQFQDLGGAIPTFIANNAAVDVGFKSIANFRQLLEKDEK